MMLKVQIVLLLTVALLAGCGEVVVFGHTMREGHAASEVKAAPDPAAATATKAVVSPAIQLAKEVRLSFTSQTAEKIANDSRFNADALMDAIKGELQSRKLFDVTVLNVTGLNATGPNVTGLDVAGSRENGAAEISIDEYALRPTTNFVLFGAIINVGTLNGNLVLHDEYGNALPSRRIEAQARISIPENGADENLLRPLYHEFAVAVVDTLTGTSTKPKALDQPPR